MMNTEQLHMPTTNNTERRFLVYDFAESYPVDSRHVAQGTDVGRAAVSERRADVPAGDSEGSRYQPSIPAAQVLGCDA